MATILLSAAGAALGSGFGGTVLGLSGAVIGRAVGATIGQSIDQRILGAGSEPIETGRVDRFQLTGASDGTPIQRVWGRMRIGGQVIWATRFQENATRSGGSKGAPRPTTTTFSYSVSLAIALCQGEALRVGRIWADGNEIAVSSLDLRFYPGSETQLPDAKIEAVEGAGNVPSYRGIAYVVIEDLDLSRFGNRVPQFAFEVVRRAQGSAAAKIPDISAVVRGVALIPGTGEYGLATTPVHFNDGPGVNVSANVHSVEGRTDLAVSLIQLTEELPGCGSVSLVVSWFGSDLRCGQCKVQPKVEGADVDGIGMPWQVSGLSRGAALVLPKLDGRPVYGGTPTDQSVIEAITAIRAAGKEVMFYPFILMDQLTGNGLADPWSGALSQPHLPWRGRITLSKAPGLAGTPDRTAAAASEVAAFLGAALPSHFLAIGGAVAYSGPADWGFRRFILHYAKLCALAGGVDAFCIGSELRGLGQVRAATDSFPMVQGLVQLAAEVRAILGSATKISYAADWSEYFGYHADNNVYFHLDPLWSDANIDFVGIDNYMPLSDWRDGPDHSDAHWGSIYNIEYLKSNVVGGEGYDWFYESPEGEAAQLRQPITDGAYGETWVYRYKDLAGWWGSDHHGRIGGVRSASASGWAPGMKPIRFTEYGCAALDKGTNQPNKFLDPKSSESSLPRASDGHRDDYIQMQYLRAIHEFWSDPLHNPLSTQYSGPMLDLDHCHVWAWDARPFPEFPGNADLWGDGANYARGHWLNGRSSAVPLAAVAAEICDTAASGFRTDVSSTYGVVRGYVIEDIGTARAALQPLSLTYAMDVREREGTLQFYMRSGDSTVVLDPSRLAIVSDLEGALETSRSGGADTTGRVRLTFIEAESDFEVRSAEAVFPDETSQIMSQSEVPLQLTNAEARTVAERWLAEARVARDTARFALPRSQLSVGPGDVVTLNARVYRIDRLDSSDVQMVEAVRVDPGAYRAGAEVADATNRSSPTAPLPVFPLFLDLPLLSGDEAPQSPHLAVSASPWLGPVAVWSSASAAGFSLNKQFATPAIFGVTENALASAMPGLWDNGMPLRVKLSGGQLSSAALADVLNGVNVAAVGDGSAENWEVFQFSRADLVAPRTYDLSVRLRGQLGSDAVMPATWPPGSYFVLLDNAVSQIDLALSARGLERFYRIGLADRGYSDSNVVAQTIAFNGIGLRPYSVSHMTLTGSAGTDVYLTWIRRTRIEGDSWVAAEVPVGEETESYRVRVLVGPVVLREIDIASASWTYSAAMQLADSAGTSFAIAVAQVSGRFGPGVFKSVPIG